MKKDLGIIGTVGRFKPLHNGHATVLEAMCERADHVYIGIGSTNRYNLRNPFTKEETQAMIHLVLQKKFSNYSFVDVPDLDNGPRWREQALIIYGKLNHFITTNNYVETLLKEDYDIIHTFTLLPSEKKIFLEATMVRIAMAKGENWEKFVPDSIADYIKENKLDERFCKEFGLATLKYAAFEYNNHNRGAT